jgi:hypothetical protein
LILSSQKHKKAIYIGECTRLVSDIIYHLKEKNQSGILLLIDFAKAFDSLEWNFLDKTLEHFNFGKNIRKWMNIFYNKIESCIINNGNCSDRFELSRSPRRPPLTILIYTGCINITNSTSKQPSYKSDNH